MIYKSLWLPVFIVFITIFIPNTLIAGPAAKCPCFSSGQIERDISKGLEVVCLYYEGTLPEYLTTGEPTDTVIIARIGIIQSTGVVGYSIFGNVEAKLGLFYPACGTFEQVFDLDSNGVTVPNSGKLRIDIQEINNPESTEACVKAIMDAYPECVETGICSVLDGYNIPGGLQCNE